MIKSKNDMVSAWRNFKNIFSRPLYTIIFRPEMLKFDAYSILTGETMVGFVIYCVLSVMCVKPVMTAHLSRAEVEANIRVLAFIEL